MKKLPAIFLAVCIVTALAACGRHGTQTSAGENMLEFYYRQTTTQYDAETGAVASELRAVFRPEELENWLPGYLLGPASSELQSPFPRGVTLRSAELDGTCVRLLLSEEYGVLSGVNQTIANACLTLTLTQIDGVESVQIEIEGDAVTTQDRFVYAPADFVTYDDAVDAVEVGLKVYYSDRSLRYLLSTTRQVEAGQTDHLPDYIVGCLIAGPTDDVMQQVMPEGTKLLGTAVDDGVCTLNFNQAFYDNRPDSEAEERVLIYSIVNSVTALSGIHTVRFEIEGEPAGMYLYLDLSLDYKFNEDAVGPVRSAVNEFDGTLYLTGADEAYLAAVPLRIRLSASQTMAEATMQALLSYQPPTGLTNPIPSGTELLGISMDGAICRVDLSEEFGARQSDAAVRSIVLSLTSIPGINRVQLLVEGELCTSILAPSSAWRYPNP